jgi:hypothetical protein
MKRYLLLLLLAGYAITVQADDTANMFALQAGNIAGAAEQCGQDASILIARSKEVINVIAPDAVDQSNADVIFDKSVAAARANQATVMRKISCSDVLTTYNSLPLLRSDYKQSVIAVLTAHRAQETSPTQPLVTAKAPNQTQIIQQMPSQQDESPIQSVLANEMPLTADNVQSYVSAKNKNNTVMNNNGAQIDNNFLPQTATPSSDIISVTQAFNQGNLNHSADIQQNEITNNQ